MFDFVPARDCLTEDNLVELDRWAIKRCQQLQEEILSAYENYHFHVIYQKIHNFCAVDMGSFYLDIIKDRQYTTSVNSNARRSCQTAMYHILHALTRWLAPILSFTAEEIWQAIPGHNNESIFVEQWYQAWPRVKNNIVMDDWQQLHSIRDEVNKALENQRQAGLIGSALAADVTLYASAGAQATLAKLGEELRFVLITSSATVCPMDERTIDTVLNEELGVAIRVQASLKPKCGRCWHRSEDVGTHPEHPELCQRCIGNISGDDELRLFA